MIASITEYEIAKSELQSLEERLRQLHADNPDGAKGFTKAGVRKMIARLHEQLAVFEASAGSASSK